MAIIKAPFFEVNKKTRPGRIYPVTNLELAEYIANNKKKI